MDWTIRSKLGPSIRSQTLLPRDALLEKLEDALHSKVTVLHAPAGYGKTSLLASWYETLRHRKIPVAWLSLDHHDKDQFQFLSYVAAACSASSLYEAKNASRVGISGVPVNAIVDTLLLQLSREPGPLVLILDDFHRAETSDICDSLNHIVASMPDYVHVVLSSREYPSALSLADLKARDELIDLDQKALRFSSREVRTFLGGLLDEPMSGDFTRDLLERTEGWPIALKTVHRWVSEGSSITQTLNQLSGRSSDLADYFLEQVFENLTEAEQLFLLKTSILERVNGDLANALCGIENGWTFLEELERRDLFVQSLDRERHWYRYHRLFAEFLHERLRRRFKGSVEGLHTLAANWFFEHQFHTEAVQHAIESGNSSVAARLLEQLGGWQYAVQGHVSALESVLGMIETDELIHYPRLLLGQVFVAVRRGNIELGEQWLHALSEDLVSSDDQLKSERLLLQTTVSFYADNEITSEHIVKLEALHKSISRNNDLLHAALQNLLCALYARQGKLSDCMAAGDKAIGHFRSIESVWGETFVYFHEGQACMNRARLRDTEVLYSTGLEIAAENFGAASDLAAIACAFLAELFYAQNNVHQAVQHLERALPHIDQTDAWIDIYIAAYTTAIKIAWAASDTSQFQYYIDCARSVAHQRKLPRLRTIIDLQVLELGYRDNCVNSPGEFQRLAAAASSLPSLPITRWLTTSINVRELVRCGESAQAIAALEDEKNHCLEHKLMRWHVANSVLLATVLWEDGQQKAAMAEMELALASSLFEASKRVFIDEGEAVEPIIRELTKKTEGVPGNRLKDRFLAELMMELQGASRPKAGAPDELSNREREILRFLVQGRSNREIAAAKGISINTVKFHVKNLFSKLGVRTRKDAVSASIRRELF